MDQKQIVSNVLERAQRLTLKIGTNSIIDIDAGHWAVKGPWLRQLVESTFSLNKEFSIVSSGAIGLERVTRNGTAPADIADKQAFAALGQPKLQQLYEAEFARRGERVGQVLLTRENLTNDIGLQTSRNTLRALRADRAYALINENDSVANEEIKFGDNDQLAAYAAHADEATTLILITDVNGLYTANPKKDPNARHLPVVETLTPQIMALGTGAVGDHSKGGMETKLCAAYTAAAYGIDTIILNGEDPQCLARLFHDGDTSCCTIIPASAHPQIPLI